MYGTAFEFLALINKNISKLCNDEENGLERSHESVQTCSYHLE